MNEQEMTFGQALDWLAKNEDKEIVTVGMSGTETLVRLKAGRIEYKESRPTWAVDDTLGWNFGRKWRPYVAPKPKSAIEEAIEREAKDYWKTRGVDDPEVVELCQSMARIANTALDEAKKAATSGVIGLISIDREALDRIDALKVTP